VCFLFDRRTDPFSEDLLPTEVPSLLHGLPDEDVMSDDEMYFLFIYLFIYLFIHLFVHIQNNIQKSYTITYIKIPKRGLTTNDKTSGNNK